MVGVRAGERIVNWKRIVIWSLIILAGTYAVALASALTMGSWEIYGRTLEEAVANSGLVRRIAYTIVAAVLFWRFAAGVQSKRVLHVLAAYMLVQILDMSGSMLLGGSIKELFDPWAVGRGLLAATSGLGLASLGSNKRLHTTALEARRVSRSVGR
jgi:hypothetical protein